MFPFFRPTRFSKRVLVIGFKVKRCHVIEDNAQSSFENCPCVINADFLNAFLLFRVQFV